eukprot:COSAG01_NODE_601_length_14954_cov_175.954359_21_plen_216_part_00
MAGGGWLIEWSEGSCYDNKMSRVPGECWVCVHTLVSYASESSGGTEFVPVHSITVLGSCDLVHAFHQMFVHKSDQYLTAFGNNILGCWCWARGSQGTAGTPAAFYNFCHAALSKHGVLYSPDFDVSDLEKNDYLDFDTDEKGEFILNEHGHRIPSPQGYCKAYCDDLCLVSANIEEHKRQWRHLVKVLQHIRLKISPDKTKIGRKYLNFLSQLSC